MDTKYDNWEREEDEWLADAIYRAAQEGNREERDVGVAILYDRYQPKLLNFAASQLSGNRHSAEDTSQIVWLQFTEYAGKEKVRDVKNLLYTIARRRCADERDKQKAEMSIENDIASGENVEDSVTDAMVGQQLASPLVPTLLLSDCERVLTTLKGSLKYPSRVVGRLLGKKPHNIDVQISKAYKRVEDRIRNDEFYKLLNEQNLESRTLSLLKYQTPSLTIEVFNNPIMPDFTPDELKPIGITTDTLRESFEVSLVRTTFSDAARTNEFAYQLGDAKFNDGQLYIMLTEGIYWTNLLYKMYKWPNRAKSKVIDPFDFYHRPKPISKKQKRKSGQELKKAYEDWRYMPHKGPDLKVAFELLRVDVMGNDIVVNPEIRVDKLAILDGFNPPILSGFNLRNTAACLSSHSLGQKVPILASFCQSPNNGVNRDFDFYTENLY